jgi:hypothetical protein
LIPNAFCPEVNATLREPRAAPSDRKPLQPEPVVMCIGGGSGQQGRGTYL